MKPRGRTVSLYNRNYFQGIITRRINGSIWNCHCHTASAELPLMELPSALCVKQFRSLINLHTSFHLYNENCVIVWKNMAFLLILGVSKSYAHERLSQEKSMCSLKRDITGNSKIYQLHSFFAFINRMMFGISDVQFNTRLTYDVVG